MAVPLAVRGVCPKCRHVVNTHADKGRATWRGPCPVKDCKGVVVARRVKDPADVTPEPAQSPQEPAPAGKTRRRPVRADGYVSAPEAAPEAELPVSRPGVRAPAQRTAGQPPTDGGGTDPTAGRDTARPDPGVEQRPARADHPEHRSHATPYGHLGY